jgi:hypothetical protein
MVAGGTRKHARDTHLEFSAVHLRCYACVRWLMAAYRRMRRAQEKHGFLNE